MCRFSTIVLAVLFLCTNTYAANLKGVAAVLLPNWNNEEADLLIATIAAAKVKDIEISFWATYKGSKGYAIPKRVINGLLSKQVRVRVRVFLGDNLHQTEPNETLALQADQLNNELIKPYSTDKTYQVSFRVSPTLEDSYPSMDIWKTAATTVLNRLEVSSYNKLRMVRCYTDTTSGDIPVFIRSKGTNVTCETERHPTPERNSDCYSNDGQFVFRRTETFINSVSAASGTKSLKTFKHDGSSFRGSQLLWRPSYNLHPVESVKQNGDRQFDGIYRLADRLDRSKNKANAFDEYEAAFLRSYLR